MFSPSDEAEEAPLVVLVEEEGPQVSMSIKEQPWRERCGLRMLCSSVLWPVTHYGGLAQGLNKKTGQ